MTEASSKVNSPHYKSMSTAPSSPPSPPSAPSPPSGGAGEEASFLDLVLASASNGASGAIVGAMLAAVSDPIVNRVLVERITLLEAMNRVSGEQMLNYFYTTLPTNFIKFPLFEVLNTVIRKMGDIPPSMRGVVTGAIFTTATLPLTNYRFCKSMGQEVSLSSPQLWVAYPQTVLRDIVYANTRGQVAAALAKSFPEMQGTPGGQALFMFLTVLLSCILSSPLNEWRGYTLQPKEKKKSFQDFFQLERYLRSTLIGGTTMGLSLGLATFISPVIQKMLPDFKDPKVAGLIIVGLALYLSQKEKEEGK